MNSDAHPSQLQPQEYSFALNTILEDYSGSGLLLSNESSNLLCSRFKDEDGWKIIGIQKDVIGDRVFFFLVNVINGCSEIGYIAGYNDVVNEDDIEKKCPDCSNIKIQLADPLEDLSESDVIETCEYITLISDCEDCPNNTVGNFCLNFNINNPISSEIKQESRCGTVLYFTDDLNPRRRFEPDNIEQYYTEKEECTESEIGTDACDCGTKEVPICINCEKFLLQKPFRVPCIDVRGLVNGGSLKHGVYVFYAAYADGNGNEMTRYMAVTGEISVKDPNKNIYQQSELDAPTNYSIKLHIDNLDEDYEFFKLAVKQLSGLDSAESFYDVGTFPITSNEIIYSGGEQNLPKSTKDQILADYPEYLTAKTVEQFNNYLSFSDLTTRPEVNLQPIVNLIGQFARWRTAITEENLYASAEATTKYRSYLRDEQVPFAIRFLTKNGYVTSLYPLISRVATDDDLLFDGQTNTTDQQSIIELILSDYEDDPVAFTVDEDWRKDVFTILVNSASQCTAEERFLRWQYYNTATETGDIENCGTADFDTSTLPVERVCAETTEINLGNKTYTFTEFEEGEIFTTLANYIRNHQEDLTAYPEFLLTTYDGENENPVCCEPDFFEGCSEPTFINTTVTITPDIDESDVIAPDYKDCDTYSPNPPPEFCNVYETDANGDYRNINPCLSRVDDDADCKCRNDECYSFSHYIGFDGRRKNRNWVFAFEETVYGGGKCSDAHTIMYNTNNRLPSHFIPLFDDDGDDLTSNVDALSSADMVNWDTACVGDLADYIKTRRCGNPSFTAEFAPTIHTTALWYKHVIDLEQTPFIILDISEITKKPSGNNNRDCLVYANVLRVSIYESCSSTPIATHCVPVEEGKIICLDETFLTVDNDFETGDTLYVAIDTPLITVTGTAGIENDESSILAGEPQYLSPTWGCFAVNIHQPFIESITYTSPELILKIRKICTYESDCPVRIINEIKCDPIPWKEGKFAYWESTINYPNNSFLYDSSSLKVPAGYFDDLSIADEFVETFTDGTEEESDVEVYILNENTDFKCKPIRHFKFPDLAISPITDGNLADGGINPPFKTNKIFPIGFYLDNDVINRFLDLAVLNSLITQEFRDDITGYEIFKGDVRLNRSIIGKGLIYDMYQYTEEGKDFWFSNFPYNDLRENILLYEDGTRDSFIQHPFESNRNIKFTFHSPEFHFDRPAIPFELKTEAYFLGNSRGKFTAVRGHPDFILLGESAYRWATALGTIEATLELLADITDQLIQISQASFAGLSTNWGQAVGWVGFGLFVAQRVINYTFVDLFQKRYEWLKVFRDNGTPHNFAAYYASEGFHNSFILPGIGEQGNLLRGLRSRQYLDSGRYSFREDFEEVNINHLHRESAVYLSVGKELEEANFSWAHPAALLTYDNSRTTAEQEGACVNLQNVTDFLSGTTKELIEFIYSPYVSLKNYVPAQYGDIDAVKWMPTHYCGDLSKDNSCDIVFGGETFLSRFYLKRKFPFFINPMLIGDDALAPLTPFSYSEQRNVGFPVFYVDFETDMSLNFGRFEMPDIRSYFNLDCYYEPKMYVKPPSKFYLYYYGIPSFIVESRVNLNYRYGQNSREKDFAPNQTDYIDWTQEKNVSIREDNYYFYNPIYSHDNDLYAYRILPFNYDPEKWDCRSDHADRSIYSLQDSDIKPVGDFVDRWSVFRANDKFDFGGKFGKLYMLKNIEQQKVLALFDNGSAIFNAYNTLKGGEGKDTVVMGDGGVFATLPNDFFRPGYGGTQHRQFVSCQFGHFWTDAKRGRVYNLATNASGFEEISSFGLKNWFRENLPFTAIKKQFPNISDDALDNPYKDFGILLWWDARFDRLFLTKKDYKLNEDAENCCIEYREGIGFVQNLTECTGNNQVPVCPDGFTYDATRELCVRPADELSCEFDLMFVIDKSGSVDAVEMAQQKNFVNGILEGLRTYIESGDASVGFVTFANTGEYTQTMLTGAGATDILKTSVNNNIPNLGSGGTSINEGLCAAHQEFLTNGRLGFTKKIITLTDGNALHDSGSVRACAPLFDNAGSYINTESDLNSLNYENLLIGINPVNATWINNWNILHNATVNGGNAYIAEFTTLETLIEDILFGVCEIEGVEVTVSPTFEDDYEVIYPADSDCFIDCSWTVAWSPLSKSWISYYSFLPSAAVSHDNYFQTIYNWDSAEIYSHLLTNRSFTVFQGTKFDWKIMLPLKNDPNTKFYEKINYKLYAKRYSDTYSFIDLDYNFTEAMVFNHHKEATGRLRLKTAQENNLNQYLDVNYNATGTQILATKEFDMWEFGGLFDNAIKGRPLFTRPCSNADILINDNAFNYTPTYKNLIRSSGGGSVLFIENQESRIKFTFEFLVEHFSNF